MLGQAEVRSRGDAGGGSWHLPCVRLRVEAVQREKPRRPRENSGVCSQWGVLFEEQANLQIPGNEGF